MMSFLLFLWTPLQYQGTFGLCGKADQIQWASFCFFIYINPLAIPRYLWSVCGEADQIQWSASFCFFQIIRAILLVCVAQYHEWWSWPNSVEPPCNTLDLVAGTFGVNFWGWKAYETFLVWRSWPNSVSFLLFLRAPSQLLLSSWLCMIYAARQQRIELNATSAW